MTPGEVAAAIEQFVRTQFRVALSDSRFSRSQPLFDGGYVDSVGVVELLAFIRQKFAVEVPDEDLMSDQFGTIDGMAAVVARLYRGPAAGGG